MSWKDVQQSLRKSKVILVPTGSIEQHGPHLPLNTDVVAPYEVSLLVARKLGALVAPPIRPGVSEHHLPFPGTITLTARTFMEIVKDYARSLNSHGFDPLVFINGHGGNSGALSIATAELRKELSPCKVISFSWWEFIPKELGHAMDFEEGFHANRQETSWMLHLRPKNVKMHEAKKELPRASRTMQLSESFYVSSFRTFKDVTKSGVLGNPTKADAGEGKRLVEAAANNISRAIREVVARPAY